MWVVNSYVSNYRMYMTHIILHIYTTQRWCGCKNTCALAQYHCKKQVHTQSVLDYKGSHTHTSVTMSKVYKFV